MPLNEVNTPEVSPENESSAKRKPGRPAGSLNKKGAKRVRRAVAPQTTGESINTVADAETPVTRGELMGVFEKLVGALIESRKPYKDPAHAANEDQEREQFRKQRVAQENMRKMSEAHCTHMAGNRGDQPSPTYTNIHWHTNELGNTIGICKSCIRIFTIEDADYYIWLRKPSQDKPSRSGNPDNFLAPGDRMVPGRLVAQSGR